MIKLAVSPDQALQLFSWVKHDTFQQSINEHWSVDSQGRVKAQSVLWLFCWAKTGMNSVDVARQTHRIFNKILSTSFEELDAKIPHEWAQIMRYQAGDIEEEFYNKIVAK